VWPWENESVRVDGKLIDPENMIGPGLSSDVEPATPWRGIIVFRQSEKQFFPAVNFGALVGATLSHPLASGKHTVSVRCQGVWSDEFAFYWEPETN
jgi:hypothetical protein